MSSASVRTVLPLALVTGTSMLAMDLFLPAVPTLRASLGIDVVAAQATVAVFLAGLAASQLVWGEALNRLGPRRCVVIGVSFLILSSVGCALAPDLPVLLALRLVQGFSAGAAMIVAPSVVRATLSDADAVRGIATISMVEALVPAAGPVLGAALLVYTDWRGTFWLLAAATLLVFPITIRVTPRVLPGLDHSVPAGYRTIFSNRKFVRLALSHAFTVGALLMFVASAPQLLANVFHLGSSAFAALQVIGVAAFIVTASQSGRIAGHLGVGKAVKVGAWIHVALCLALCLATLLPGLPFAGIAIFWVGFCGSLAVRGPSAVSDALAVPSAQMGRASAALVLAILIAGALGTQLVAPLLDGASALPVAIAMLVMTGASALLVTPYPSGTAATAPIQ